MTKVYLSLIVFFCSFTFNISSLQAVDCYDPLPENIECQDWIPVQIARTFPTFSNCTLTVRYSYRECIDNSCAPPKTIIQYALGGIDIPDNCTNLMAQLYPGWPNNFGGIINVSFWNALVDHIFLTLGKEKFLQGTPNLCTGPPPNCDLPTSNCNTFEIYYSNPRCLAYCLVIGPVLPQGYRQTSTTPIYCPSESPTACCEHRKLYCLCGTDVLVTEINNYTSGNCNSVTEPIDECPEVEFPMMRYYIPCSSNCSEE